MIYGFPLTDAAVEHIRAEAAKQRAHDDLCERVGIGGVPGRRELLDALDALLVDRDMAKLVSGVSDWLDSTTNLKELP